MLIAELTGRGFAVQLQHDAAETDGPHGWVEICDAAGVEVLARQEEVQHNRHYHERADNFKAMADAAVAAAAALASASAGAGAAKPTIFAAAVEVEDDVVVDAPADASAAAASPTA